MKKKKSFLSQLGPEPDSWFLTISNEALYFVRPLAATEDREKKKTMALCRISDFWLEETHSVLKISENVQFY